MDGNFNAEEIFEIAIKIERNGARFYRKAADGFEDPNTQGLLNDLAGMEDEHEKIFAKMQQDFESQDAAPLKYDPDDQSASYLHAMADGRVFDVRTDPSDMLTGMESLDDILKMAIGLEKDSIAFYVGIKDMVPEGLGKDQIGGIIREEMGHVVLLSNALKSLKE
jgi:rubrerythrin